MDRRKSLKALLVGTVSTGVMLDACKTTDKKADTTKAALKEDGINRMNEEAAHEKEVNSTTFFTPHEMKTIAILADIIIPKDDVSGSATDAKVPDFIEFIVKCTMMQQICIIFIMEGCQIHSWFIFEVLVKL